ncbi:pilus assembly protein [Phycicoccus sp. MAQZ13P-2]|uniref:TadE/TadG family type IV pilus assembly protein n=1 Tax=Phycicoccus mangrovi TaxID=2840470 RepID=UPI001BFFFA4A|nr:TadE/TadG family type IV pilus assembly protein [Phycicoccus mangrovi]MBT9273645.1 pilus assembly protein [Phycicoccus mangrovi]
MCDEQRHLVAERGSVTVWMITTALSLVLMVGLAVDLSGRVLAKQRAQDLASEAARAGGQQLQGAAAVRGDAAELNPSAAVAAANTYLSSVPEVSGSSRVRGGTTVVADTQIIYTTKFLSIIGVRQLRVTGHAEVEVNRAVNGSRQ